MNRNQMIMLGLAGALGLAGFIVGYPRLSGTQRGLVVDLVNVGLIGTLVGVPLGLWAVPRFRSEPWKAAAILTAASYATKALLLPHEAPHGEGDEAMGELIAVYD